MALLSDVWHALGTPQCASWHLAGWYCHLHLIEKHTHVLRVPVFPFCDNSALSGSVGLVTMGLAQAFREGFDDQRRYFLMSSHPKSAVPPPSRSHPQIIAGQYVLITPNLDSFP